MNADLQRSIRIYLRSSAVNILRKFKNHAINKYTTRHNIKAIEINMVHYLAFDANCMGCKRLAEIIKGVSCDRMEFIDINGQKARALLAQVYPIGWKRAPYLILVDRRKVRAWTNSMGALRLIWLLGARRSWKVWRMAQQTGVRLLPRRRGTSRE